MKCNGTFEGAKLKAEPIKDEDGNVTGHESFWLVTLKVPAERVDSNEFREMVDELLDINVSPFQQSLELPGEKRKSKAA